MGKGEKRIESNRPNERHRKVKKGWKVEKLYTQRREHEKTASKPVKNDITSAVLLSIPYTPALFANE